MQRINVVYTTAFTKKPVSMRYRGIFDLVAENRNVNYASQVRRQSSTGRMTVSKFFMKTCGCR